MCEKLAKKLGATIGNVWNLLTNRIHSCKASTSFEIRDVSRRLELVLNSVDKCAESVTVFLIEYDQQVRDSDDARYPHEPSCSILISRSRIGAKHVRDCVEGIVHVACKSYDVATVRYVRARSPGLNHIPQILRVSSYHSRVREY